MPVDLSTYVSPFQLLQDERPSYLGLDQHQIDEQNDHIMLDIFVGEALAPRTLRQSHTLAQRFVVGFAVGRVQCLDWEAASSTH